MNLSSAVVTVTGAGGFIGGEVVRLAHAAGAEVHHTRDPEAILQLPPDLVIHCAAPVDPSRDADEALMHRGIVELSVAVAEACRETGARLVHVGTCEEYGDGPAPFREDQPPSPVSPYSRCKVEATQRLRQMPGLRVTVARPFLTYGPGQRGPRLIPSAIRAALASRTFEMTAGTQTREFNFVEDIARGLLACRDDRVEGLVVNIGGGPELRVIDVVRRIFGLCGAELDLIRTTRAPRIGEVERFLGDHERARRLLAHQPRIGLEEGLARTIEALRCAV
ncbi:MAG TPA: NAD-dependent epimerase/dehydratase family protein [Myxococcota bacterium]|nr:NAD-dependent epimerase/dehydratase family protein [Myxococcota bacterium]